uniref:DUF4817 domain-containing protein n=1 Tax=Octopus bimaculoides TaxID=37653 RepID=A0A0L8H9A4_OCTBM
MQDRYYKVSAMANNLNQEPRKWILKQYWKSENAEQVYTTWPEAFHTPPSRQIIYRIRNKFDTRSSVSNVSKSGHPKTCVTERNEILVAMTFVNSPKKSTQHASLELSIQKTLQCLMHKLKLKPFYLRLVHGLLEDDPDCWLQFCEKM